MQTQENNGSRPFLTLELVAVLFVCAVAFFAGEILTPILPLYLSSLGNTAQTIGLLTSVMMIGIMISEIFWGWVIDRVDLRIAIFVGTVLLGISIGLMNRAETLLVLAVVLLFYGVCRSPIFVVGRWYMSVYAPPGRKAFAMALLGTVIGVVQSIGGFVSGFIAQYKGFHFSFTLAAGLALAAGILILIIGPRLNFQKHQQHEMDPGYPAEKKPSVSLNTKLITLSLGFIGVLFFVGFGIFNTYVPLFSSQMGINTSQIGILFGVKGLVSTIAMIPLGRFGDRHDKWVILSIGMGIVAVSLFRVAVSGTYGLLLASAILFALGSATYIPTITALLSHSIPVFWTGTAMGIFGFLEDLGWMLGPAIGGFLWAARGPQSPFFFASIVALMALPFAYVIKRKLGRGIEILETQELMPEVKATGD